ncbi:MAG: amino acid ABC transporter permease [Planctomycetota bacterium]|jgi:polar amino acid transport system permease protein|nr:amino acid ABC transporter permease [Planctomycetota bacterium]
MIRFTFPDIVRGLVSGLFWTVGLSLIAFLGGGLAGFAILMARLSRNRIVSRAASLYIEFFQGAPLLMQLFLVFFGFSLLGFNISPLATAASVLTLYAGAYLGEIWRGSVESLPRGQWEAAESLALGRWAQLRLVILPQALRISIPPTVGFSVQLVKGTAVTSIIGFLEITKAGTMIANATYRPLMVYGLAALGYFLLCFPLSLAARRLERRFHAPADKR